MRTDIDGHGADSRAQHTAIGPGTDDRMACRVCHAVLWQLLRSRANGAESGNAVAVVSMQADRASTARTRTRSGVNHRARTRTTRHYQHGLGLAAEPTTGPIAAVL